jgi:hypothetical protein
MRDLPLRTSHGNLVAGLLSAGEVDLAVVLLLKLVNLGKTRDQLSMIKSVNIDDLRGVLRILTGIVSIDRAAS